jgi:hypothetical protein
MTRPGTGLTLRSIPPQQGRNISMEKFKKHFMVLVSASMLLLFAERTAYAQSPDAGAAGKHNSLTDDAWALQFQVASNFTLSNFQGTAISLKRQLSPSHAVRLGIGGSLSLTDNTNLNSSTAYDTLNSTGSSSADANSSTLQINLQYLWYPDPDADVNLFFGAGPLVAYSHSSSEGDLINTSTGSPSTRTVETSEANSTSLGISGLIGAEWFAFRSFSLHAEYGASARYSWSDNTTEESFGPTIRSSSVRKSKGWSSPASAVKFGVSVYF